MKKSILLVDDHELVRKGLRSVIDGPFAICGEGSNGQEAVEKSIELKPDLIVLDISMPVMNGIEAARQIRRVAPETKIVLLSIHDSPQFQKEANAVADGFVTKTDAANKLLKVINQLMGNSDS